MATSTEEVRHLKAMLAEKDLEIEQLRMQVEDLRQAQLSPYSTGNGMRQRTWREFGRERNERCDHVTFQVINPALDILQSARRDIQMLNGTPAYTRPLEEAHNAMCDAEALLEERDYEEDEEEAEPGSEEDELEDGSEEEWESQEDEFDYRSDEETAEPEGEQDELEDGSDEEWESVEL